MTEKEFEIVLNHCTEKQYNFIMIDTLKAKFTHNFNNPTEALRLLEEYRNNLNK